MNRRGKDMRKGRMRLFFFGLLVSAPALFELNIEKMRSTGIDHRGPGGEGELQE